MNSTVTHSVVVPIFNEEAGLQRLFDRLSALVGRVSPDRVEFILVNDGSRDGSGKILDDLVSTNRHFKVLHLSRNFGHQMAITAGLEWSEGQTVSVIDADLQDPPELIVEMIAKWKEGFDVVYAVRRQRQGETFFKLWTARIFYRMIQRLAQINIPIDTGDFRLMDRKVVDSFLNLRERHRFVRGMVSWLGYRQTGIFYDREERKWGKTHYPLKKMIHFAMDGITSFSVAPLQIATYLGFLTACAAFLASIWVFYVKFLTDTAVPGWTSVILVVLALGGAQLVTLGIIGAYLGRTYNEVKRRPLYLVGRAVGFKSRDPLIASEKRREVELHCE